MIVNDLPTFGAFVKDKSELAGGVATAGGCSSEEELPEEERMLRTERAKFDDFEAELAHPFGATVGALVAGEDFAAAARKFLAQESYGRRVFVSFDEGFEVATIPGGGLGGENGSGILRRGGQAKKECEEFSHRRRLY